MTELTHLSLFSGIGGLDLAAEAAGFQAVGQCEWADYPTKVLEKHWPDVPRWRDIRTLTGDDFYARTGRRSVTVISGGFPCQPFSVAGKRRGKEDDRYLWPEMCRVISEIRPAWVIGENVPGIINLALDTVLSDLESQGYTCQTFIIPACGVDAPHKRERIAIVAHTDGNGCRRQFSNSFEGRCDTYQVNSTFAKNSDVPDTNRNGSNARGAESERQQWQTWAANGCDDVANPLRHGSTTGIADTPGWEEGQAAKPINGGTAAAYPESTERERERRETRGRWPELGCGGGRSTQPGLGGVVDGVSDWLGGYWPSEPEGIPRIATGIPHRVDKLKCYGNAVVPPQFYPFFRFIAEIEKKAAV